MMLAGVRMIIRVAICLAILVVAFLAYVVADDILFARAYAAYGVPVAIAVMVLLVPVVARLRLGKR